MRRFLFALLGLLLIVLLSGLGVFAALNTAPGRAFATREINHFAGPTVQISGLAGHFPADLKLASVTLGDANGPYATAQSIELRWHPLALLHRNINITSLTAAAIDVTRAPVPAKPAKPGASSPSIPNFSLDLNTLSIPSLTLAPALAGEPVTLSITGAAHLQNLSHGAVTLHATTPTSDYALTAALDPAHVDLHLTASEPPNGLLGHFAGPQINAPLNLDIVLNGPRNAATLNASAALGPAALTATGTLSLNPASPAANVTFTIPAIAPFAAIAHRDVAGSTRLHLDISKQPGGAALTLAGQVALTSAPYGLAPFIGQNGTLSLLATLQGKTVNLQDLTVTGAKFSVAASGTLAAGGVNLFTQLTLNQLAALSPSLSGNLTLDGNVIGSPQDFAVNTLVTGDIRQKNIPSGPFSISIDAQHLPQSPTGTLTGSGALENFPLLLDADFARTAAGAARVNIHNAIWRSLNAQADLALAPGAMLPTGTATFTLANLSDFAAFSPVPLHGSVEGGFSHPGGQSFKLDLTARNLLAAPSLGPINATLHALGPTTALAIRLQANLAALFAHPAQLALAGILNLNNRSANLQTLTAAWHQLNLRLLAPTQIATLPGLSIRHLSAILNGGRLAFDGALTPTLNARISLQNFPVSLATLFAPTIQATGTLSANAALAGTLKSPSGTVTLTANAIHLRAGPAAAIPPADLTANATLAGQAANVTTRLTAGPDIALTAAGLVPEHPSGPINLHLTGRADLRLLDPILAVQGTVARGTLTTDIAVTGSPTAPRAKGGATLAGGSFENIASGLNLTHISAAIAAAGQTISLQFLTATAGLGTITAHGTVNLATPRFPLDLHLAATRATPISSDIVTETIDAALTLNGVLLGPLNLSGAIKLDQAQINIPKSLPPTVANLPILDAGAPIPPPPAPPPPIALNLLVTAPNRIFVRGDGLFAELGGKLGITGTAASPNPEGGFTLIRGDFSLAGRNLQFTQGTITFNGDGFMPTLDLEATTTAPNNTTATLIVGGTAAKPTITLTSTPPLPSDEILAELLFSESTANLTPFQAATLAAALAQISGVGGGANPLDSVRNALGLDELSLGGSGTGPPSLQAGRYVAPGVYVGATQATNGQGTQASVQVNLYKGLKLLTTTGSSATGTGDSSSVGLTYQFNY